MANPDQLEIIDASGQIDFFDLDPQKGITNIGRHSENDVVIDSPGVALFQAVLDHQHKPYHIMALTDEAEVRLRGQPLPANLFYELHDWDSIEIDGHTLVLLEGTARGGEAGMPAGAGVAAGFAAEGPAAAGAALPAAAPGAAPTPSVTPISGAGLVDERDDLILMELSGRDWTVDVEQPANCQLTIINGGHIVATFSVAVEGLDPTWVTINPPKVNLNEGGRANLTISMSAPRRPSSRAGAHRFAIQVSSPNYPGHSSRLVATLTVNPFYEFTVGDLSPKKQSVGYFKRTARTTLPISNKGNSEATIKLEAEDDRKACSFEFQAPDDPTPLFKQAEMRLDPEETLVAPVLITPLRRQLISLRSRRFNYTVTASMTEGAQIPRTLLGTLKAAPLIGPGLIALAMLLLTVLVVFFFRPCALPDLTVAQRSGMRPGNSVTLNYAASRFASLQPSNLLNQFNAAFLKLTLDVRGTEGDWQIAKSPSELTRPTGASIEAPMANVKYRLRADTWLSSILPLFRGQSREVAVYVSAVEPKILRFGVDRPTIISGETATLFWEVSDADSLILEHDGIQDTLTDAELLRGHRSFVLEKDTTFSLTAGNVTWSQPVVKSLTVDVLQATPTPIPTPVIIRFDVDPLAILVGESVRIGWEVTGADTVSIQNVGDGLPLKGDVGQQLVKTTLYQLVAIKSAEDGTQAKNTSLLKEVVVSPQPTATPVPVAPQIMVFAATPKEVIAGKGQSVRLTWAVSGDVTDVAITAPNLALSGLKASDSMTVTVDETTLFVLTASNGALKSSISAEVKAIEPTPTPTPTPIPTAVPPPTATPTPFPPPVIAYFKAEGVDQATDTVIFVRQDQGDSGPIYVYRVVGGSHVRLSWEVRNAEMVTLQNFGPQPAIGNVVLPEAIIASTSYMLQAQNNGGANQVSAFVQVEITSPEEPPAPGNVSGVEDRAGNVNTITWTYKQADRNRITGFRIYRANFPPGTDFIQLATIYDPAATSYADAVSPTCGRAYFVVALYTDYVTGGELETPASTTSWYSRPCE